jgi:hypothetical protein
MSQRSGMEILVLHVAGNAQLRHTPQISTLRQPIISSSFSTPQDPARSVQKVLEASVDVLQRR